MILLARHSSADKYNGLTYFITPVAGAPGVTDRALIKITGQTGFNEVLFEDAVIPDTLRVDEVGKGWQVAMTTLTHERGAAENAGSGGGQSVEDRLGALIALAKRMPRNGKTAWDDAIIRDRLMQIVIRVEGFRQVFRRARVAALTEHPMRLALSSKVLISELNRTWRAGPRDQGRSRRSTSATNAPPTAPNGARYMNSYGITIAAGTSEIQRNILGERVLGLTGRVKKREPVGTGH